MGSCWGANAKVWLPEDQDTADKFKGIRKTFQTFATKVDELY